MSSQKKHNSLVIWAVMDGKPGHENQAKGLVQALSVRVCTELHVIPVGRLSDLLKMLVTGKSWFAESVNRPDLIIGAGHRTHLTMLYLQKKFGGLTVVLMKPSLPTDWFDLCVIPAHDKPAGNKNILETHGVLNTMLPATEKKSARGLILIGGGSRHYHWDSEVLMTQIHNVISYHPGMHWSITSSRRTPDDMLEKLGSLSGESVIFTDHLQTSSEWVREHLDEAEIVWVTPDSMSMIYEALTAGATVGLFDLGLPKTEKASRVRDDLVSARLITEYANWVGQKNYVETDHVINESARVADYMLENKFINGGSFVC